MRPEIIGFVLGALIAAYLFKEFRPRAGSAPIVRFVLGAFAMIGALVFLGCPWRAMLRLAGGDGNAIFGLLGLVGGIWIGTLFLQEAVITWADSRRPIPSVGWTLAADHAGFSRLDVPLPPGPGQGPERHPVLQRQRARARMHAPLFISLGIGLVVGILAQRSRFCTMGAFRDLILFRQIHLLSGVIALVVAAFITNLMLCQFHPGFANQPVAHTMELWNFGGMVLAGLAFALAGGCPGTAALPGRRG